MFWNKEKITKEKPASPKINRLTIYFTNGGHQWWQTTYENGVSVRDWKNFYKWFFSRKQSESHTIISKGNSTTILRKNIYSFRVDILEDK